MPLTLGTHLGPYEVGALLGAGGMGEVYRGRDPRLGRDVAIKILPPQFLTDPERLDRFQREARAVAALNHPNIVAIYDAGSADGMRFIVCELLTGGTLRDQLTPEAPLLVRRSVEIAHQIARGLAAAHARGIVHRDLKPENIWVGEDGVVKILDFGLSRLKEAATTSEDATTPGTEAGRILGTVGYMAPEQVLGQPADHRADIFAFGAILYEMLAGRRAFIGDTSTDRMTAILTSEPPDIFVGPRTVTPALEGIVRRCLEKRPDSRFQSASDLSFALEMLSSTPSNGVLPERLSTPRTPLVHWLLGVAMIVVAAGAGAVMERRFSSAPLETTHATFVDLPGPSGPDILRWCCAALSDDGHRMAYAVFEKGTRRLWIGSLDQPGFTPIAGTDGISSKPFWSPDGQHLGFLAENFQFKTVNLLTGLVENVSTVPAPIIGGVNGAWNGKGDIILTSRGLFQCRSSGGPLKPLVLPDVQHHEYYLANPHFLADDEHYVFSVARRGDEPGAIYVGKLGSDERKLIGQTDSPASYVTPGYVLFTRDGTLFAQRLDPSRLELSGQPVRLVDGLATSRTVFGESIVVASRTALYFSTVPDQGQFTWFDRGGHELARVGGPLPSYSFDVSADGANVVTMVGLPGYLWQIDARGDVSRLTDGADDADPRFNADATSVLFGGTYDERRGLDVVAVHENTRRRVYEPPRGAEQDSRERLFLHDWSRDGLTALVDLTGQHREISAVTLSNGQARVLRITTAGLAQFSPDGKWIAYHDIENGRAEVFVVPFPPTGERWRISPSGGQQPQWRADGQELYYLDSTNALTAVDVRSQPRFAAGPPRLLFHTSLLGDGEEYRVTADGQRFLLRVPVGGPRRTTLVLNWPALLTK